MTRLRTNVLSLVGFGYLSVIIGFFSLWKGGLSANDAYDAVKEPLMALIGGSLALSKDVLRADDNNSTATLPERRADRQNQQAGGDRSEE